MKRLLVLAVAALCACAPRYGVTTARDPFAGTVTRRMHGNMLSSTRSERDWMALDAEAVAGRDSTRWWLVVDYRAADELLDIRPGASLLLLVDGQRVALSGAGSARARGEGAFGLRESARFAAPASLMEAVARAKDVRVRVIGRSYYAERAFGPANLARFRAFVLPDAPGTLPTDPPPPDSAAAPPPAP